MMLRTCLTAFALTLSQAAAAQDAPIVGTSVIGGKRVELLGDQTWRYVEDPSASADCVPINAALSFCGTLFDWRPLNVRGTDFTRIMKHDDRSFGGIIYEDLGAVDGITLSNLQNIVIEAAAGAAGIPASEVVINSVTDDNLDGTPVTTISYNVVIDGLNITYLNSLTVGEKRVIQFLTWTVNQGFSEERTAFHQSFLDAIELEAVE